MWCVQGRRAVVAWEASEKALAGQFWEMSWTKLMDLDMIFWIVTLDFLLEVTFAWAFEGGHQQPFWKMITRCHKQNYQWLSMWFFNAKDIICFFLKCMHLVYVLCILCGRSPINQSGICFGTFFPTTWSKSKFFKVHLAGKDIYSCHFHQKISISGIFRGPPIMGPLYGKFSILFPYHSHKNP